MTSDGVTVRVVERADVTPAFLDDAAALLGRAFDGWPRHELSVSPQEHLVWKTHAPVAALPAAVVAELEGRLVGYRTVLPRRVLVQGEPRLFLHFVDVAVDPQMQGRGVYRAMQDYVQAQFHPHFDLSIDDGLNPVVVRGRARLGTIWDFGNPIRPYILPLDASRALRGRRTFAGLPAPLVAAMMSMASRARRATSPRASPGGPGVSIEDAASFDARFDQFCADASRPFALIPERTAAFLNWRYLDRRGGDYAVRVAQRNEDVLGYCVVKVGSATTSIVDLLVRPGMPAVAAQLLADAIHIGRGAGSALIECWMAARHPYRGPLNHAGFVTLGRTTSLKYRAVSMPEADLAFLRRRDARMHLTHGDTDFI